ncbi:hypothetical protein XENOCAPTIV_017493, partial [Xenoophorus captivus]
LVSPTRALGLRFRNESGRIPGHLLLDSVHQINRRLSQIFEFQPLLCFLVNMDSSADRGIRGDMSAASKAKETTKLSCVIQREEVGEDVERCTCCGCQVASSSADLPRWRDV